MRLATVLTPISPENLALAAQCGVTDLTVRYPSTEEQALERVQRQAADYGLRVSVVEGYLPIERLKLGSDDGSELRAMRALLQQMHDREIALLCYNFMSGTDWVRTRVDLPERGGATVTEFRQTDIQQARSLNSAIVSDEPDVTAENLWRNLDRFLTELLPTAEKYGITLAMHPDDPPLPVLLGRGRIMHDVAGFERLVRDWSSPRNKICFCQGTFAAMGVDIPATIRQLGSHIAYVHFRDVRGSADSFAETFHDNGPTDMAAAMQAYADCGFDGPMRPDHVPQFVGESGEPGYTMLGRLFAYGYMRGLIDSVRSRNASF